MQQETLEVPKTISMQLLSQDSGWACSYPVPHSVPLRAPFLWIWVPLESLFFVQGPLFLNSRLKKTNKYSQSLSFVDHFTVDVVKLSFVSVC